MEGAPVEVFFENGESPPLVEDLPQLGGGVDVERLPRLLVYPALQLRKPGTEFVTHILEVRSIDTDAGMLHSGQDCHQRQFEAPVEVKLVTINQLAF